MGVTINILPAKSSSCWIATFGTFLYCTSSISHWPSPYLKFLMQLKELPNPNTDILIFYLPSTLISAKLGKYPIAIIFDLFISNKNTHELYLFLAPPYTRLLSYSSISSYTYSNYVKKRLQFDILNALRSPCILYKQIYN